LKELVAFLARHRSIRELVISTLIAVGIYLACVAIILLAERRGRRDFGIYRSRNALNDLAYAVFYKCSVYNVLVFPLFALVVPHVQFLRRAPLRHLPKPVAVIACWIMFDLLIYWVHRLQHAVLPLWAFHSVHHTQTQLTFLSANRIHFVEQMYTGLLMMLPAMILGVPQPLWFPLLAAQTFSEAMQHARLDWTFGRIGRFIVSPAFHAVHHSTDEREYNGNYGLIFSVWDAAFGTFVTSANGVRRFGVDGMDVHESLAAQFLHPFRLLLSRRHRIFSGPIASS
jgi:sterol desaturase/sphingolipid hydroxylase (fatty acid hydroxylase superfamily)